MPAIKTGAARLNWLCDCPSRSDAPVVVVAAAHPDDEVVSAGARLVAIPKAYLIYVTDGAPRNMHDARRLGFETRDAYAKARRAEAQHALSIAGIGGERITALGFADQEAALNLAAVARNLASQLALSRPDMILTHAYEGGHPDHDATAFGAHAAVRLLWNNADPSAPVIIEFASYHAREEGVALLEFLPDGSGARTMRLTRREREIKRQMIAAHSSQASTIRAFPLDCERFRVAPDYDFTRAPHHGLLHYERYDWGMSGERFRSLAAAALNELHLIPPI